MFDMKIGDTGEGAPVQVDLNVSTESIDEGHLGPHLAAEKRQAETHPAVSAPMSATAGRLELHVLEKYVSRQFSACRIVVDHATGRGERSRLQLFRGCLRGKASRPKKRS